MPIHFELTTPEEIVERDEAEAITATTPQGEVTILPGHIPLVTPLVPGRVTVVRNGKETDVAVHGGFLEVRPDDVHGTKVILLADGAARAEEIDEKKAEEAKAKAEQAMHENISGDHAAYLAAQANYEQAIAMLRVARRRKHRS